MANITDEKLIEFFAKSIIVFDLSNQFFLTNLEKIMYENGRSLQISEFVCGEMHNEF